MPILGCQEGMSRPQQLPAASGVQLPVKLGRCRLPDFWLRMVSV